MKKLLIISFAVAVLAIGGGVFIHTALIGSDPILPLCSKTERTGIYRMKSCKDCDGPTGKYAMDIVAYCN